MLHRNTRELTVSSQVGMAGGCTIEFGYIGYAKYVDPEDGETYVEFEPELPEKYSWYLSTNGISAYCNYEAHKPCPAEFLALVNDCAVLALQGHYDMIVQLIKDYKTENPFIFGE